jgi:hypothetical protein
LHTGHNALLGCALEANADEDWVGARPNIPAQQEAPAIGNAAINNSFASATGIRF